MAGVQDWWDNGTKSLFILIAPPDPQTDRTILSTTVPTIGQGTVIKNVAIFFFSVAGGSAPGTRQPICHFRWFPVAQGNHWASFDFRLASIAVKPSSLPMGKLPSLTDRTGKQEFKPLRLLFPWSLPGGCRQIRRVGSPGRRFGLDRHWFRRLIRFLFRLIFDKIKEAHDYPVCQV